jgi:hypothetical protein
LRHSIDISHIQSPDSLGMICERESHWVIIESVECLLCHV